MDLSQIKGLYVGSRAAACYFDAQDSNDTTLRVSHFCIFTPISVSALIAGAGRIIRKYGTGVMTLSNPRNAPGRGVVIQGSSGGVIAATSGSLGEASSPIQVASGTSLGLAPGVVISQPLTGSGAGSSANAQFISASRGFLQAVGSGKSTYSGNITTVGTADVRIGTQDGASLEISGVITSVSAPVLMRSGGIGSYIILTRQNSWSQDLKYYGGSTQGGVRIGIENALTPSAGLAQPTAGSAFNFDLNGYNQTVASIRGSDNATTVISNMLAATTSVLTINTPSGVSADTLTRTTIEDGSSGGKIAVVKTGSGTQRLVPNNTYSGGTTLAQGRLVISRDQSLGTGPLTITGGSLDCIPYVTLAIPVMQNPIVLNGNMTFVGTNDLQAVGGITLSATRQIIVSAKTLTLGGSIAATSAGLIKSGAGTLVLSGNNRTTGPVTVSAGTLVVGHISALGSGAVTVNAGATLNRNGFLISNQIINNGGTII